MHRGAQNGSVVKDWFVTERPVKIKSLIHERRMKRRVNSFSTNKRTNHDHVFRWWLSTVIAEVFFPCLALIWPIFISSCTWILQTILDHPKLKQLLLKPVVNMWMRKKWYVSPLKSCFFLPASFSLLLIIFLPLSLSLSLCFCLSFSLSLSLYLYLLSSFSLSLSLSLSLSPLQVKVHSKARLSQSSALFNFRHLLHHLGRDSQPVRAMSWVQGSGSSW